MCEELLRIEGLVAKGMSSEDYESKVAEIVTQWEPKFPTIALYVRWAKTNKRDYNSDSIALLTTLAEQSGFSPLSFLTNIRSYLLSFSRKNRAKTCPYRFSLSFAAPKNGGTRQEAAAALESDKKKKIETDKRKRTADDKLKIIITGIRLSCRMLNVSMMEGRNITLAVVRYKKKNKDDMEVADFRPNGPDVAAYTGTPRFQTHLLRSFENRVWQEIEFRFLAYQTVKFIFENALAGLQKEIPQPENEFLAISFSVLSNCKERRDGWKVLYNLCIAFGDIESVEQHKRRLRILWDMRKKDDINMGLQLRQYALQIAGYSNNELKVKKMNDVFSVLRAKTRTRSILPKDKSLWWVTIRAQVFRTFLDLPPIRRDSRHSYISMKDQLLELTSTPVHGATKQRRLLPPPLNGRRDKQRPHDAPEPEEEESVGDGNDDCPAEFSGGTTTESTHLDRAVPLSQLINESRISRKVGPESCSREPASLSVEERKTPAKPSYSNTDSNSIDISSDVDMSPSATPKNRDSISNLLQLSSNSDYLETLSICHPDELRTKVESELVIQHPQMVYHLSLAPLEVYSAGSLATLAHQRVVNKPGHSQLSEADCHVLIGSRKVEYIDPQNVIHVARPESSIFANLEGMLPKLDIGMLVKTIIENGEPSREDGRSPDSIRWHLAAAGQGYDSGSRRPLSNVGFNCRLVAENKKGKDEILFMIGQICSFVWECTQAMQDRSGQPRLGSDSRNQFSQKLRKFLNIERHQMGFESITMGIMEIYPNVPRNEEHYDKFNCGLVTSNRTGGFNMVIVNPGTQKLYLLQFLLNFRVQITNYVMPYHSSVTNLVDNIRSL
eukprot:scaffold1203_cov117-Cylindrotheca_fusiformis.AAC.21